MADFAPYGESPEGFEVEPYRQIEAAPEEETAAIPAGRPTEAPERAAPGRSPVPAEEAAAEEAAYAEEEFESQARAQAFAAQAEAEEAEEDDDEARLEAAQANKTAKCYRWGKIMVFLFPPVGVVLLLLPVFAEKIRQGSFLMSLTPTGLIAKALAERKANEYAAYSMYQRHMAKLLATLIPAIWYSAVLLGVLILTIYAIQVMACEGTVAGFVCWAGQSLGILSL